MSSTPPDPKAPARGSAFRRNAPAAQDKPAPKPPKKARGGGLGTLSGILSFLLIGAFIGLGAFVWAYVQATRPGPLATDKTVNIGRDEEGGTIGEQLEAAGIIDSATWFRIVTLLDGQSGALKRGEYAFKAGESMRQVEAQLASGKVVQHKLTIPEGLTSEQIAARIREADFLTGEIREPPKEGSILPQTYDFNRGASRESVIQRIQRDQTKIVAEIWQKRSPDLPIKSPGELVTLASIVEKETGKADERPHVAGVFVNRINKHMRLQSDPTIVYGLVFGKGTLGHSITRAELDTPTQYNTYQIDGLPPGPICNPGRAALEAVANPLKTKDLFFVADGTGGHAFAETVEAHNANVARWRQLKQDAKDQVSPDAAGPTPAPSPTPKVHGQATPIDPRVFAALAQPEAPVAQGALAKGLAKLAERQRATDALLAQDGPLGKLKSGGSLEDIGAVVSGVNDPASLAFAEAPAPAAAMAGGAPAPAKDLFDDGAAAPTLLADSTPRPAPKGPHRIYDASEGTPLDPLLNKSWDLNNAQSAVPLKP